MSTPEQREYAVKRASNGKIVAIVIGAEDGTADKWREAGWIVTKADSDTHAEQIGEVILPKTTCTFLPQRDGRPLTQDPEVQYEESIAKDEAQPDPTPEKPQDPLWYITPRERVLTRALEIARDPRNDIGTLRTILELATDREEWESAAAAALVLCRGVVK